MNVLHPVVRGFAARTTVLSLIGSLVLCGCVSVQKSDIPPESIRDQIRSGELAQPGDRVSIVTKTTGERVFTVTEVDQEVIRGNGIEVPIDDVVAVTTLGLDVGRTLLAAGGIYVGLGVLAALAVAVALGDW